MQLLHDLVDPHLQPLQFDADIDVICSSIEKQGFCRIPADQIRAYLQQVVNCMSFEWSTFQGSWSDLPMDGYMADGGTYRRRRHTKLSAAPSLGTVCLEHHQPHFQAVQYNAMNGGIFRNYEPVSKASIRSNVMKGLIRLCCQVLGKFDIKAEWDIEVHQFRIETNEHQDGKPTPEGIHQDGVSFVLIVLISRKNICNGRTGIFDLQHRCIDGFTMSEPFDAVMINDARCMHSVSPISPVDARYPAHRDVLVITFRKKIE